jgi:hypothetical protein
MAEIKGVPRGEEPERQSKLSGDDAPVSPGSDVFDLRPVIPGRMLRNPLTG